jgi:protein-L-isoaspartate O-methyltransferase
MHDYVHGYSEREATRLVDQATQLSELLHHDTRYPSGSDVLEVGCGVGAQTEHLARNSPGARITSIDSSAESLAQARDRVRGADLGNVVFERADLFELPYPKAHFDHLFVCFVLEHLARPLEALAALSSRLRPGGTLTVIEGDHGSALFHPPSADAQRAIDCLVQLQARAKGDALIGRRLYPLLRSAGFADVSVSPRFVYADASRPAWVRGFTLDTFTAMVAGAKDRAVAAGLTDAATFDRGVADLERTAGPEGVFCYTFFKAVAVRSA